MYPETLASYVKMSDGTTVQTNITSLGSNVTSLLSRMTTAETNISTLISDLATLRSEFDELSSTVENINEPSSLYTLDENEETVTDDDGTPLVSVY